LITVVFGCSEEVVSLHRIGPLMRFLWVSKGFSLIVSIVWIVGFHHEVSHMLRIPRASIEASWQFYGIGLRFFGLCLWIDVFLFVQVNVRVATHCPNKNNKIS
jgi:hypothetical protein